MKENLFLFTAFMLIVLFFPACTSTSTSKLISIEDHAFARSGDDGQPVTFDGPAIFKRGDKVHLVLMNVGPFKKDSTGLNWLDMDMEVSGPDGQVVISEKELLGERGRLELENNRVPTPYATFTTTSELNPGTYKFKVTIYDRIGKGTATQNATFTLE